MSSSSSPPNRSALVEYVEILRRRKWLVIGGMVIVPLVSVLLALQQSPLYEGSATVLLSRQNLAAALNGASDQSFSPGDRDRIVQTQAAIASSTEVANRTLMAAGASAESADDFLGRASVTPETNADLLHFSVKDADRGRASRLAGLFAREYTGYRRELDTASLQRAEVELSARIAELEQANRPSDGGLLNSLVDKQQQLKTLLALQTNNATVIPSSTNAAQIRPAPVRTGILALLVGTVLGLVMAFVRDALDTRLRSPDEAEEILGAPKLVEIPRVRHGGAKAHKPLLLVEPDSPDAEPFRILRTSLMFLVPENHYSIMVTSATSGEGKSTVSANLAVALALSGKRVILVDADLRRPTLESRFGLERGAGLTDVAVGAAELDDALVRIPLSTPGDPAEADDWTQTSPAGSRLQLLGPGVATTRVGEFFASSAFHSLAATLVGRADVVLYDTTPLLHLSDAVALGGPVDYNLAVVHATVARRNTLRNFRRALDSFPSRTLGLVLNFASVSGSSYGYDTYLAASQPAKPSPTIPR